MTNGLLRSRLQKVLVNESLKKTMPDKKTLVFGKTFSDHMLDCDWSKTDGWKDPIIKPFGDLHLHPAASSLHYGLQCFEGMKAYRGSKGEIRMFRPDMNMERMNVSSARLFLPEFDGKEYLECMKELLRVDKSWIPEGEGYSVYIRPTHISTHPFLGVSGAEHSKLFTILCPVGPYYKSGFAPIKLLAEVDYIRAFPGGAGFAKIGGNYAPTILPTHRATSKGYSQILWLFGPDNNVTEAGTMNFFTLWVNEQGEKELITAPLDGTILPGVTRDSILTLAREWNEFKVSEKPYTMEQVIRAQKEDRLLECFGCGTAAIVSPVRTIGYRGVDYEIPLDPKRPGHPAGALTQRIWDEISKIQYGKIEHPWSVVV